MTTFIFGIVFVIFVTCKLTEAVNAIRTIIYTLKRVNDQSILSIDLTANIVAETVDSLTIKLPHKDAIVLNKYEWVNKDKIYDDGKVFFMVCNKQRNRDYVQDCLARHAMEKVDDRIEYLFAFKNHLKSLIKGQTLQVA